MPGIPQRIGDTKNAVLTSAAQEVSLRREMDARTRRRRWTVGEVFLRNKMGRGRPLLRLDQATTSATRARSLLPQPRRNWVFSSALSFPRRPDRSPLRSHCQVRLRKYRCVQDRANRVFSPHESQPGTRLSTNCALGQTSPSRRYDGLQYTLQPRRPKYRCLSRLVETPLSQS